MLSLLNVILVVIIALLVGMAVGYHLRPRIIRHAGGGSDEAAILARLGGCEEKLIEIRRELRHAEQVVELYKTLEQTRNS